MTSTKKPHTTESHPNKAIRILVVEDHSLIRQGIVAMLQLQNDFTVVAEAEDGQAAIEQYQTHQPDITLMDLRMPRLEGVDAISQIRARDADAKILILTTYDTDEEIYRGLQAGARGYLLKDTDFDGLVTAVHTVYAGKRYLPQNVAAKLLEQMDREELTDREREVLNLILSGSNTATMATALHISEGTVKFHINNIFQKFGVNDRTQAVIEALRRGIIRL
ncbi:response regulator transcription factor [filamentous cyanobacterium LEGE 11480]|uniref:Response regulator transcription factor n=1 Tax=Romeriopsis navalis LEGE 11480 TaxID=2777977 RepID=A0A928Z7F9_9CYAN|nr:response regulator transcription factor [Romeriopsis navalis]MBE9033140.1 response regulator transcription factor [Romeriopsis navalis LEGE 11480]